MFSWRCKQLSIAIVVFVGYSFAALGANERPYVS